MAEGERKGRLAVGLSPSRILVVAALFIVAYFGVSSVSNAITRYDLSRREQRLRGDITQLEAQQRRLKALQAYMQTDEFIERSAREQGLVKPGDIAVAVVAPAPATVTGVAPGAPWWERYFGDSRR